MSGDEISKSRRCLSNARSYRPDYDCLQREFFRTKLIEVSVGFVGAPLRGRPLFPNGVCRRGWGATNNDRIRHVSVMTKSTYTRLLGIIGAFLMTSCLTSVTFDARGNEPQLKTASTHPIQYYLSLPEGWTAEKKWPVVVVIESADREFLDAANA